MVGRMDNWITGTERKHFHIHFPFRASITIGLGVIFLITNSVNKQIILEESLNHKSNTTILNIKEKTNTPLWNSPLNKAIFIPPNFRRYGILYPGTLLAKKNCFQFFLDFSLFKSRVLSH